MATAIERWLHRPNSRHPWNHNEHFHGWILRNLPARRRSALDIGCGTGVLVSQLASRFADVTGVDADPGMVGAAARGLAGNARATVQLSTFADFAATAEDGALDLITMVAVLHHLDLPETLQQVSRLLAPEGRLLVVGLARAQLLTDVAIDLVSVVLNPLIGVVKHPRPVRGPSGLTQHEPSMPVRDPTTTLTELALAALPGSSLRRRLFFRYTLRWDKPAQ